MQQVMITKHGDVCVLDRVSHRVVKRHFVKASPLPEKKSSPRRTDDCRVQPDKNAFLGPCFGRDTGETRQSHTGSGRGRPSKKHRRAR